jgi:hypothetical protein
MSDVNSSGERDAMTEDRDRSVLLRPALDPSAAVPASLCAHHSERFVQLNVNGRPLQVPQNVLNAGASDLQLTTEGYVALADYAASVALVLSALERLRLASFQS